MSDVLPIPLHHPHIRYVDQLRGMATEVAMVAGRIVVLTTQVVPE